MSPATIHLLLGLGTLLALAICILVRPLPERRSADPEPDYPPLPLGATWQRAEKSPCRKASAPGGAAAKPDRKARPLREYRAAADCPR